MVAPTPSLKAIGSAIFSLWKSGNKSIHFSLLAILLFISYSNTINSPWHLDDYPNIVDNKNIHLSNLQPQSIKRSFYHWESESKFHRPMASLSFALNWYWGKNSTTGYHLTNILIHLITTLFLYLTIIRLLLCDRFRGRFADNAHLISLLAVAFWATNPIQTQAVTYIVQRMTSLAAMFSIMSIYSYLSARLTDSFQRKHFLFTLSFLLFVLAFTSKENSFLLPGSIILIELFFLQKNRIHFDRKTIALFLVGVTVVTTLMRFSLQGNPLQFINGYGSRFFTLAERLLTEPRIIIFYLSQIFYPLSDRFSLEHDIIISTSLLEPWTTLPAILLIISTVLSCIYFAKRFPLISFSLLFYFYNHLLESTVIPLELIFEHRNYLPSFFLFLPIAVGVAEIICYHCMTRPKITTVIGTTVIGLLIFSATQTYYRNGIWKNKKSRIMDSIHKAPNKARPYHNLAFHQLHEENDWQAALDNYLIALDKQHELRIKPKYIILSEIIFILANFRHDYLSAIPFIEQSTQLLPKALTPRKNLVIALISTGQLNRAMINVDILLSQRNADYVLKKNQTISRHFLLNLKALILLKQHQPQKALLVTQEAMQLDPNDLTTQTYLGMALSRSGNFKKADLYLQKALNARPKSQLLPYLIVLENYIRAGSHNRSAQLTQKIITSFSKQNITNTLSLLKKHTMLEPVAAHLLEDSINVALAGRQAHHLK